jgi:hypothetical protein
MVIVPIKELRLVVEVDDLDFRIRNIAFEAKVFNRYGRYFQRGNFLSFPLHHLFFQIYT